MEEKTFDFDKHKDTAMSLYREVRGLYEDLAETITRVLKDTLSAAGVSIHSIEARAKTIESFGNKAAKPSPINPQEPKYSAPLKQITDLSAVRIITFLPGVVAQVCECIESEFFVLEKSDKAEELIDEGRFGYQSVHFLVKLPLSRIGLPEYKRFTDLTFEIQIRTILQHAWAEMEHDIQYKSASVIPAAIRRRFIALAGMLEIADREFQALQEEDQTLRVEARTSVEAGQLDGIEITPDALKAYLHKRLGGDARQNKTSYELSADYLKRLGFTTIKQLDDCLKGYDDDATCRVVWGNRQGQITRFDTVLLASMGEVYIKRHPWSIIDFWAEKFPEWLDKLREAGITIGTYDPLSSSDNANRS
ncbi:GTP pyrophosphokinase [Pseudomonas brassicacearum subsp. neoaurantiaca]|jgi:Uncharacterized protein conserved in bacteria|uniref:GTP pyrophosphokinase n=1 Tax=Pseudomonas brassicacearum TaxID=930166 RepID=UPI000F497B59|nr:(p)ppGpp synthetase [Pseudomonas brassicacearum]ROM77252.1 hypothetical protein BK655_21830 [Pseudomonas brassicacearum]